MCEFCLKHGEGEKWYLQTKNYSEDLLADVRRRRFIEQFSDPAVIAGEIGKGVRGMERLQRMPRFISYMLKRMLVRNMKKVHFGQVVPIEEDSVLVVKKGIEHEARNVSPTETLKLFCVFIPPMKLSPALTELAEKTKEFLG